MKKIIYTFFAFLLFAACTKENNTTKVEPVVSKTVKDLPADTIIGITPGVPPLGGMPYGAGKYTFYSIEKGTVVPSTVQSRYTLSFNGCGAPTACICVCGAYL